MPQRLSKPSAAGAMRLYSIIALCALILFSCATAVPVRVINRYDLSALPHDAGPANTSADKDIEFTRVKYLVRLSGSAPSAAINNRSVELCLKGKFSEAEILLLQIPPDDGSSAAVSNNLGVIYECSGDVKKARDFYLKAAALDPAFSLYRDNVRTTGAYER